MAKKQRRIRPPQPEIPFTPQSRRKPTPLVALNETQKQMLHQLTHRQLIFAKGPAGCGKTYLATRFACELLEERKIDRIIVTRPMVEAEEKMGFLPGTPHEKFAPYFAPVREIMEEHLGRSHVENLIKNERIELAPIAFLRGHTFKNAFVLFDEAQNTTVGQMKLFLTRIGEGARVCVSGDPDQVDIPGRSGLVDAVDRFHALDEVGVTQFDDNHVVRCALTQKIVRGYK